MNSSKLTLRTKLLAMFFTALTFNPFSVQPILADVHDVMQKAVVTGTVVDDQGEPIIGATVTVVGGNASQGAISDMDGNFSIQVSPGAKLKFSYLGMSDVVVPVYSGRYPFTNSGDTRSLRR